MEKHSVSRLIGSPPGYVGYEEGGLLTERVRRHPYSLVLFDEIEKAHPDVFNLLLQILDDGILTDSHGHSVNFKNTIIIMTSNIGADLNSKGRLGFLEETQTAKKEKIISSLSSYFKSEFINRIDDIVVFERLSASNLEKIAEIQLSGLIKRCEALGITLSFGKDTIEFIAKEGTDERYGARPIRRAVTRLVEDPLATQLLEGKIKTEDVIEAKVNNDSIIFEKKKG
jgi:ATP-dependent Clp protease ATP-binding subunit ClpC